MDFNYLFKTVSRDFGEGTATPTVAAAACHMSLTPEDQDFIEPGRYTRRLREKIRSVLWEYPPVIVKRVLILEELWGDYTNREAMDGHGGCKKISLVELYNAYEDDEEEE